MKPFFFFHFLFAVNIVTAQVNVTDSLVLVALYESTNGSGWTNHTNWLTSNPVSTWYGVTTAGGYVDYIELYGNNLTGEIPEEIGNLSEIRRIDFASNNLTGEIPASLSELSTLQNFYVHVNQLTGTFPADLYMCQQLKEISAYKNEFSGPFPETFLSMPWLTRLELGSNNFTGQIPAEINTLTELELLGLERNQFTGTLPRFDALTKLSEFHISGNYLEGDLQEALPYFPNMYYFRGEGNRFTGILSEASFNPERIQFLDMPSNELSGLGDFSNFFVLSRLNVHSNQIPFEYLEPNRHRPVTYWPQQNLLDSISIDLPYGSDYIIHAGSGGAYSSYQWFHNGALIEGASGPEYVITDFSPGDGGIYHSVITNDSLPQLTLTRNPVELLEPTTSVLKQTEVISLKVYPNPAFDLVHVEGVVIPDDIMLWNEIGQVVTLKSENNTINVSQLTAGNWYLTCDIDGRTALGRLTIIE